MAKRSIQPELNHVTLLHNDPEVKKLFFEVSSLSNQTPLFS